MLLYFNSKWSIFSKDLEADAREAGKVTAWGRAPEPRLGRARARGLGNDKLTQKNFCKKKSRSLTKFHHRPCIWLGRVLISFNLLIFSLCKDQGTEIFRRFCSSFAYMRVFASLFTILASLFLSCWCKLDDG